MVIALAYILADDGEVARALAAGEVEPQPAVVHLVDFDGDDFLQGLDAALHLVGLGGLVAEAFDEGACLGNLLLLVLVGAELLFAALGAQGYVFVILDLVVVDLSAGDFDGARAYVVDKRAVVRHHDHRPLVLNQELFEPLDAADVEVVGGLVEEQYVGLLEQNLGQLDAHSPSAREFACGAVEVGLSETESCQRALQLSVIVRTAHHAKALVGLCESFHERHVFGALVVGALGQLLVQAVYLVL